MSEAAEAEASAASSESGEGDEEYRRQRDLEKAALKELKAEAPGAWRYVAPVDAAKARGDAGGDGYFGEEAGDTAQIAERARRMIRQEVKPEEDRILPKRVLRDYFKAIYWPLKFTDEELSAALEERDALAYLQPGLGMLPPGQDEDDSAEEPARAKTLRLYRALGDVSRETQPGVLHDLIRSGAQTQYGARELDLAHKIYREVIEYDVQHGGVTLELLRLARDPSTATQNVTERGDELDEAAGGSKKAPSGEELKAKLDAALAGAGLETVN